jgi:DNA-binding transcriptional MocR family regulator
MSQVQQMTAAVGRYFPAGTKVTRPQGGYVLWLELPSAVDALELHRHALARKISIAPGPIFSATQKYKNCIRLSCGLPWSEKLDQAIHTLGDLANKGSYNEKASRI